MLEDIREVIYSSRITKNSICVEVGVHRGLNAEKIIRYKPQKLYLIDCWDCRKEQLKEQNIIIHSHAGAGNEKQNKWHEELNVEIIKEYSNVAVKQFNNNYFDFIYIDGLHDHASVLQDLNIWSKKLKDTGIIICDDYVENTERGYGVISATKEFLKTNLNYTGQEIREQLFFIKRM